MTLFCFFRGRLFFSLPPARATTLFSNGHPLSLLGMCDQYFNGVSLLPLTAARRSQVHGPPFPHVRIRPLADYRAIPPMELQWACCQSVLLQNDFQRRLLPHPPLFSQPCPTSSYKVPHTTLAPTPSKNFLRTAIGLALPPTPTSPFRQPHPLLQVSDLASRCTAAVSGQIFCGMAALRRGPREGVVKMIEEVRA